MEDKGYILLRGNDDDILGYIVSMEYIMDSDYMMRLRSVFEELSKFKKSENTINKDIYRDL
jgi:hypothetical protein